MRLRPALWMLSALALAACSTEASAQAARPQRGYLPASDLPTLALILPPPPAVGSGALADDQAIFARTRALQGQPRWAMALGDNDLSTPAMLNDFACALGVGLNRANAPILSALFDRAIVDHVGLIEPAKQAFARQRPFVGNDAPICIAERERTARSPAYPSGHSTTGWAWALILAELAPDRATEILERGRVIGESRVVCGVHWASDVEAGRTAGAVLVASLHAQPAFRADLDRARAEVAAARLAAHPAPAGCSAWAQTEARRPY